MSDPYLWERSGLSGIFCQNTDHAAAGSALWCCQLEMAGCMKICVQEGCYNEKEVDGFMYHGNVGSVRNRLSAAEW